MYVPASQVLHVWQLEALFVVLNAPVGQARQARSVVALPPLLTMFPGPHTVFATQAVAGSMSLSHFSPMQGAIGAVPPAQYSPFLQSAHTGDEVIVASAVCTVPAGHSPAAVQEDWFVPEVMVPLGQTRQVRSMVVEGALAT